MHEEQRRHAAEDREEWRAGQRREHDDDVARPQRMPFEDRRDTQKEHAGCDAERGERPTGPGGNPPRGCQLLAAIVRMSDGEVGFVWSASRRTYVQVRLKPNPTAPHEPHCDEHERDRKHRLRDPRGDPGADVRPHLALGGRHLIAAPRQQRRGTGAERGRENAGRAAPAARGNERTRGEREQFPVAGCDRRAEKADPEREVLNDRTGTGDAAAERLPHHDLAERQQDHHQQRERRDEVLEPDERALHLAAAGFLFLRNSSRAFDARSKMSGGTCSPRIVFARLSNCLRHSGSVGCVTVNPALVIAVTASASSFGTSACRRFSTPSAAATSLALSASGIAFHAFTVITPAPTIGARPISSMYGVWRYH